MLFSSCIKNRNAFADDEPESTPCRAYSAVDTTTRLASLRVLLEDNKIDGYIVPSSDAHGSEYVADKDRRQRYMSGFSGESSMAVVTREEAALFVDGRYHESAGKEIDRNWTLYKVGLEGIPTWTEYLKALPSNTRIGLDATLFDVSEVLTLEVALKAKDITLIYIFDNLVNEIWDSRPAANIAPLISQVEYAGRSSSSKLAELRKYARESAAAAYIVHNLAEIAWLLNLRGKDIPYSPVFESYLLLTTDETTLYINERKVTAECAGYLQEQKIQVKEYKQIWETLKQIREKHQKCLMGNTASFAIYRAVGEKSAMTVKSPVELWKSTKNDVEIAGMKAAYLRDAVAWVQWIASLDYRMRTKGFDPNFTEWHAAEELTSLRKKQDKFAGLAYENISATGGNAALPHYSANKANAAPLQTKTPYLNDSGAQYRDGTIDTTRTYHFGKPKPEHKRAYTRVLQGHIHVAQAKFPAGTTGAAMDALARAPLWSEGMTYNHGTGHGIGSYLNVHEGPQRIASISTEPLRAGQMVSNEPGYYEVDQYGIRIESIYLVKEVQTRRGFAGKWLGFERITQIPIDLAMVDWKLMSEEEVAWLKQHNRECVKAVLPFVERSDKRTRSWLKRQTL